MPSKNQIPQTFLLTISVFTTLVMSGIFLPKTIKIGTFEFKNIDLWSGLTKEDSTQTDKHQTAKIDSLLAGQDTCAAGITCFQNFSEQLLPFDSLITKLDSAKAGKCKVRIAFFGDSFTDGDLVTADFRDSLQQIFGGNGVGFIAPTSETAAFRQSVVHAYSGWQDYSILDAEKSQNYGINGHCYIPEYGNTLMFKGTKHFVCTNSFDQCKVFYQSQSDENTVNIRTDSSAFSRALSRSTGVGQLVLNIKNSHELNIDFPKIDHLTLLGFSLESESGVYLDNFALKGNSGTGINHISTEMLQQFNSLQQYDMIFLQFGLNVMNAKTEKYTQYEKNMKAVIEHLKNSFPDVPIVLVSVPDRSVNNGGTYQTMPTLADFLEAQQRIAMDNKIIFYNLFEAMGGKNSMVDLVNSKPALANKDYTHLTHNGGKKVGKIISKSFFYEVTKYQNRLAKRKEIGLP